MKEYRENNKEQLRELKKQYNENKKEYIKARDGEQIKCECGCEVTRNHIRRHQISKKHIELMSDKLN